MCSAVYSALNLRVQRTKLSGDFGQRAAKKPEPFGVRREGGPRSAGDRTETRPNPVTEEVDVTRFSSENGGAVKTVGLFGWIENGLGAAQSVCVGSL